MATGWHYLPGILLFSNGLIVREWTHMDLQRQLRSCLTEEFDRAFGNGHKFTMLSRVEGGMYLSEAPGLPSDYTKKFFRYNHDRIHGTVSLGFEWCDEAPPWTVAEMRVAYACVERIYGWSTQEKKNNSIYYLMTCVALGLMCFIFKDVS